LRRVSAGALGLVAALAGCSGPQERFVQVVANVRDAAPGNAWNAELAVLRNQVLPQIRAGDHFIVAPAGAHSYTQAPALDVTLGSTSAFGPNPLQVTIRNRALAQRAYATIVSALESSRSKNQTEIVAATMAAADRFAAYPGAEKILILDSTGYEQSTLLNMADVRQPLDARTDALLVERFRRANELPDLHGVRVCVAGISSGESGWAVERRVLAVRAFWERFFSATGATLVSYGTTLEGCLD
jgi:hypothetical protein